jgi:hypothetical protein
MKYIEAKMPTVNGKTRIEIQLPNELYKQFKEHAESRYLSNKKLAEVIVIEYLANLKKKKK